MPVSPVWTVLLLQPMIGKQDRVIGCKIRSKIGFCHLGKACRLPARVAVLVDHGGPHALVEIMVFQQFASGGKFPLQAFDEA